MTPETGGAFRVRAVTLCRLGLINVARVAAHRLRERSRWYQLRTPLGQAYSGPFFQEPIEQKPVRTQRSPEPGHWTSAADRVLSGHVPAFSDRWCSTGFPPDWNANALSRTTADGSKRHWSRVAEFATVGEDVKGVWESSRFDGLLILALAWVSTEHARYLVGIEQWLSDWVRNNPANVGIQWRCGQETSIRLIQTLLAAELLAGRGGVEPEPALARFVREHARRIVPTMGYAAAQDNNHATSEAAALYVAGTWLERRAAEAGGESARWRKLGRRTLEERVERLVMRDGSFSQHSVNYHRLALDTLSIVEWWRRRGGDVRFSDAFYKGARAATEWLEAMTDPSCGDAPNLGANDGARLAVLHSLPYRDFRPSVQLASVMFAGRRSYAAGPWDDPLAWLDLVAPRDSAVSPRSVLFPDGGYAKLVRGNSWALLRLPRYRFRPGHADALHLDVWHRGENVIRDGGSFSYNTEQNWLDYFSGTASHSTVQFDGRDQMPRLSRFLFGAWLHCEGLEFSESRVRAGYRDHRGATHFRTVGCSDRGFRVHDEVSGFSERAVVRWRLAPGRWRLQGTTVTGKPGRLTIDCDSPARRIALVEGWESRHYGQKTPIPVLEVEVGPSGPQQIHTIVDLD